MASTIKLKNGSGAPTAGDLVQGEPALDLTNKRLYTEDSLGNVIEIGTSPSTIDINAGTIDGVTLGTNSAVTEAQIDNININGNAITSTDTNGNIAITPNGTGEVDISKVDINGGTIDGVTIGGASAGAITGTTITGTSFVSSGDMTFGDNDKAIFGAGSDLQIFHDGSNSWIKDEGTGVLAITTNGNGIGFYDPTGTEPMLFATKDNAVDLYFNGAKKLATTATGIDVTGTVTADGLTVDGNGSFTGVAGSTRYVGLLSETSGYTGSLTLQAGGGSAGFGGGLVMYGHSHATKAGDVVAGISTGSGGSFRVNSWGIDGGNDYLKVASNGDISFYEDTGTTPKLFWDASAESLGLGTVSPAKQLHIESSTGGTIRLSSSDTSVGAGESLGQIDWYSNDTSGSGSGVRAFVNVVENDGGLGRAYDMTFGTGAVATATEKMRLDKSGNLGLGVTPSAWASGFLGFEVASGGSSVFGSSATSGFAVNAYYAGNGVYNYKTTYYATLYKSNAGVQSWHTAPSGTAGNAITFTQAMTLDASGRLGVGTTSPSSLVSNRHGLVQLKASGSNGCSYSLMDDTGTKEFVIALDSADNLAIQNNGATDVYFYLNSAERMRIDSSGNVGIGTSSPIYTAASRTTTTINGASTANLSFGIGGTGYANLYVDASSVEFGSQTSANPIKFTIGGTEKMRLDASGNLLVGGTATPTSSAKNIVLYNGTAPTGNATDGVILYAEDVSASSELKVRDEAGNVTTLSPHNFDLIPEGPSEDMAWSYYSERDGKRINVDMLKAIRLLEQLTGEKLVHTN